MLWRQMLDICRHYAIDEFLTICIDVLSLIQSNSTKACLNFRIHTISPFLSKTKVKVLSTCLNPAIILTAAESKRGIINHYSDLLKSKHEN